MTRERVLIVDDEKSARVGLSEIVEAWGFEAKTATDGMDALAVASEFKPAALITDVIMPRLDGFGLLARLREEMPETRVILLTGQGNVEDAVRAVKEEGAFYYFEKPINTRQLQLVLQRAIEQSATQHENVRLRRRLSEYGVFGKLVGSSHAMRQIYTIIEQVAGSAVSVLISGESGTGKEVVANTIHDMSPRSTRPFVGINCSAIPETLMESELFGHERGAFTGAITRREGCFELANTGTLFLDEIARHAPGETSTCARRTQAAAGRRFARNSSRCPGPGRYKQRPSGSSAARRITRGPSLSTECDSHEASTAS
jgi:DNA-binding NtrC family response regulator